MSALAANNAWGELSVGVLATATQLLLTGGQGDRFPNATLGVSWFFATLCDRENNLEIVKCTERFGDTLTVERGVDGTTPLPFAQGDKVELRPCAALFNDKVSKDELEAALKAVKEEWQAGDNALIERYDAELKDITDKYATIDYVDTEVKDLNTDLGDNWLTIEDAEKKYLPLSGGTLTGSLIIKGSNNAGLTITGGDLRVNSYNGGGSITCSGTVTADSLSTASDERLKKNIETFAPGVGRSLCQFIRPVWFNWKKDDSRDAGVIAQELMSVLPCAVRTREDGTLAVNYMALIPVLLSAVRDLSNEIEELKKCRTE